jgi:transcriptional regulator with XRE-family HTH domain
MQEEHTELRANDRLKVAIKARGQSLRGYADTVGIPYRSMQDYVGGKSKPGLDQLEKIAKSGIDIGYILTGRSTTNYPSSPSDGVVASALLGADDEIKELLLHYLERAVDVAISHVRPHTFATFPTASVIEIWSAGLAFIPEVAAELDSSLIDLRSKGVPAISAAEIIAHAVSRRLVDWVRSGGFDEVAEGFPTRYTSSLLV